MKLDVYLIPYIKINSKLIKVLNPTAKTIKLLEENIGVNLCELGFGQWFLRYNTKNKSSKRNIDKQDIIKIKSFCMLKYIKKVKDNQENGREILQIIHMIRDLYQEFIKSSYSSVIKRKIAQFKYEE